MKTTTTNQVKNTILLQEDVREEIGCISLLCKNVYFINKNLLEHKNGKRKSNDLEQDEPKTKEIKI